MAIGSILFGIALLLLLVLYLARPFMRPQPPEAALTEKQLLLQEKEALLDQIQVLDFDHDTGKIPPELHAFQREKLVEQATAVLHALDAWGEPQTPALPASPAEAETRDVDSEIEAAIARLREGRTQEAVSPPAAVSNGQTRYCPQCGSSTDPDDRFCTQCGHNLTLATSTKTA